MCKDAIVVDLSAEPMLLAVPFRIAGQVFILVCERRPGARVHLFVFAAPPRRCLLLFSVVRHRRAAAMSAGDDEGNEDGEHYRSREI